MRSQALVFSVVFAAAPARAQVDAAVSPSDRAGPIVVYDRTTLHVSRDDGRSFESIEAPVPNVRRVVVEGDGSIVVLGGTERGEAALLARIRPDGSVAPLAAPGWISDVASGGDVLMALLPYEGAIGIARRGGPFVVHATPPVVDRAACARDATSEECASSRVLANDASVFVDRDGTGHVVDVEVSTCGTSDVLEWARLLVVRPDGSMQAAHLYETDGQEPVAVPRAPVHPTRWRPAPHGWHYAIASHGGLATLRRGRTVRVEVPFEARNEPDDDELRMASNGALVLVVLGGALLRVDGARARLLDDAMPAETARIDVDARGRALAVADGALFRFSRASGWQALWRP